MSCFASLSLSLSAVRAGRGRCAPWHTQQPRVVLVFGRAFGAAGGPSAWPRANRAWGPLASSGAAAGSSLFLSGPPQRHRGSSGGARQTTGAVTLGLIWTDVVRESLAALRGPWWKRPITARRRRQTRLHCGVEVDIGDHSTRRVYRHSFLGHTVANRWVSSS